MVGRAVDCKTNCHIELEYQILTQFVLHVVTSIGFCVVSSVMILYAIKKEVSAAKLISSSKDSSYESYEPQRIEYTALEVQAKRHVLAKYKYLEWGGSYVEDFLELMLGFAYISIFALVSPTMIVIAALSQLVEFALLMLRMRFITGRPYPHAAEGIGNWKKVIVMIGTVAVFFNGYIAAFVVRPAWFREVRERLLVFLLFASCSLFLRTVMRTAAPELPYDVRVIEDYNSDVLRKLRPVDASMQFERRRCSSRADIALHPNEGSMQRALSSSL
ncbi:unnamed protein product [Prorocentrum cordatum]|uniref:Anoctamin transmembrane domain-containing protein n=1 Tax=Prorocentrum cordatum TaxID=2364126 RepID=A0ABN9TQU7_9DINO|nr:unnamed protein product [Polarella glacialis]